MSNYQNCGHGFISANALTFNPTSKRCNQANIEFIMIDDENKNCILSCKSDNSFEDIQKAILDIAQDRVAQAGRKNIRYTLYINIV